MRCSNQSRALGSAAKAIARTLGLAAALALMATLPALAAKPVKKVDSIWTHPNYASLGIESIALLPAVSYDNNVKNEKTIESMFAQSLRPAGYRWVTPAVAKEMIRAGMGGDSALSAVDLAILRQGRVDSVTARRLCRTLRAQAVMSVRVDLFERNEVAWNQSGKPSTTVQVKAGLVDSTGRLVWSASGSETGEGPYHEAGAPTVGVKMSDGETTPITGEGGAPSFNEVVTRLFTRWMKDFPARATNATGAASAPDSAR